MSACLKRNSVILIIIISYFCTVAHNGHIKTKCSQQIQITQKIQNTRSKFKSFTTNSNRSQQITNHS